MFIRLALMPALDHFEGFLPFARQVDDLLDSCLQERFDVLTDKGTLDAVGLSADAEINRCVFEILSTW